MKEGRSGEVVGTRAAEVGYIELHFLVPYIERVDPELQAIETAIADVEDH